MAEGKAAAAGLSSAEARARLREFGPNLVVRRARGARVIQFLRTLADPMALMLAGAAALYLLLGKTHEAVVLAVVIIPVLGVDVLMEARSRGALKKLESTVAPRTHVIRDGRMVEIPTAELVPGDLVVMREGDILHADGIVRSAANLALDESQLTGEAEPQEKAPHTGAPEAAEAQSRFFAGSMVLAGLGLGEVAATGQRTRFGNIARLVGEAQLEATPLQVKTGRLVRWLVAAAVALSVVVFAARWMSGAPLGEAFLYAISLAMSAVCEEVVLVLSLFLTLAALRLSQSGVLVKRLASVETLGATTVICMDKTGTLTAGKFALDTHVPFNHGLKDRALLEAAALACEPGAQDSLEREILEHCRSHGVEPEALYAHWRLVHDYPFDMIGKHMAHVWTRTARSGGALRAGGERPAAEAGGGPAGDRGAGLTARIVAKGALEGILEHCELSARDRQRALAMNSELAERGMRVIAVAGRSSEEGFSGVRERDERGLELYGLLGFYDPLRPEVPQAVAQCQSAGVRLKLITGDHALTAHAVAEAAGIAHEDDLITTGAELTGLSPERAAALARRASIFARVQPEQKYQIVDALVRAGEVVAMIGDGINDAPALRRAHIGVAMGRRGTEVARAAADLVLLEDDFAALVNTVREGRRVFGNIQHSLRYLTAFKVALVALAISAPLLGLPILLLPVNLVWLELIVHPVSALAFEGEPGPDDLMRRPPRDPRSPLLGRARALRSALSGAMLAVVALAAYAARLDHGEAYARGAAMVVVVMGSLILVWAELAGDRPWWRVDLPARWAFWVIALLVALSVPLFTTVGAFADVLHIAPITRGDWAMAIAAAFVPSLWRMVGTNGAARTSASTDALGAHPAAADRP
jgi:Ca2+-transporting ATPase